MGIAWEGYFADPDVIRTTSGYYAYGTDGPGNPTLARSGRMFPILRSKDLEEWEWLGGALQVPRELEGKHFWAPEVAEHQGRFTMFYSAGGEEGEEHQIRVAVADSPEGPFVDQGVVLLPDEPFSIDASPFQDPRTGRWWLFYAKDFFDGNFPGTGIAVAPLNDDLLSLAEEPKTILRASAEWQLFQRDRFWYGRNWPAWYTVEGPFCIYRDGAYRLFFSGGLWKGENYGVRVAEASAIEGPYRELPEKILASRPGLRGPGHNSVVVGPDGQDYLCFHAWDEAYSKRQMQVVRA